MKPPRNERDEPEPAVNPKAYPRVARARLKVNIRSPLAAGPRKNQARQLGKGPFIFRRRVLHGGHEGQMARKLGGEPLVTHPNGLNRPAPFPFQPVELRQLERFGGRCKKSPTV